MAMDALTHGRLYPGQFTSAHHPPLMDLALVVATAGIVPA
jgi:hypothetical protein